MMVTSRYETYAGVQIVLLGGLIVQKITSRFIAA